MTSMPGYSAAIRFCTSLNAFLRTMQLAFEELTHTVPGMRCVMLAEVASTSRCEHIRASSVRRQIVVTSLACVALC